MLTLPSPSSVVTAIITTTHTHQRRRNWRGKSTTRNTDTGSSTLTLPSRVTRRNTSAFGMAVVSAS